MNRIKIFYQIKGINSFLFQLKLTTFQKKKNVFLDYSNKERVSHSLRKMLINWPKKQYCFKFLWIAQTTQSIIIVLHLQENQLSLYQFYKMKKGEGRYQTQIFQERKQKISVSNKIKQRRQIEF
ncbi:unnamed protein product [Paramecium sonneborni]|uniref:Uncharacterized protein n=1 Tax=Paramecium sonneborni TaxID=65129 RepID=A0A8S1RGF6_9CILI|nr:unnamed protein product [Paramecium sonneborni]